MWDHPDQRRRDSDICHDVACHGGENGYCFGTFFDNRDQIFTGEIDLMDRMVKYWTNFARTGDPNSPDNGDLPVFDQFTGNYDSVMRLFTGELQGKSPQEVFEYCEFWDGLDSYLQH